jgi:hypothetical protein
MYSHLVPCHTASMYGGQGWSRMSKVGIGGIFLVLTDVVWNTGLCKKNVELARHTARHRMDTEPHVLSLFPATGGCRSFTVSTHHFQLLFKHFGSCTYKIIRIFTRHTVGAKSIFSRRRKVSNFNQQYLGLWLS